MKQIRSKALYQYLVTAGLLEADEITIAKAKREYRRLYKKQWADNRKGLKKEVRISFTQKEYNTVRFVSTEPKQTLPAFAKALLLSVAERKQLAPDRTELLQILQSFSMTISASQDLIPRPILHQYLEIETKFRAYIDAH